MTATRAGSGASVAVVWFRRDLRLADNPALVAALASADRVVPLFVHDPVLTAASSGNRAAFLDGCLDALAAELGGALCERTGDPVEVVAAVAAEVGAAEVHVATDFGPYGARRDRAVDEALAGLGCRLVGTGSAYAVDPGSLHTKGGTPFRVFTPFSRAWRAHGWPSPLPVPDLAGRIEAPVSDPRPPRPDPEALWGVPPAGERAAWAAADPFLAGPVSLYRELRDRPDLDATSRLSPHLKFGTIHPRQLLDRLADDEGSRTFASELCWREFYADVLHHRPDTVRANYVATLDGLAWDSGPPADERFAAWCAGRTGYPIVDAGMRQLLAEGWMHNRVRMITASFLVKDLHVHWRRGADWFLRHLVDGDLASNTHGWQWTAGTGTDAAPFFRVFNPIAQGERFDPTGDYVRRYVPELADIAGPEVHRPRPGADHLFAGSAAAYPAPIVDHAAERAEALARYGRR